ncbi:hypothetical protein SRB5_13620 [Streptomyces sp. RB5]|uniref:Uncharacterized protein n=1 Tax=Streptomyces smaragdinus TaxID=2585196 RepID=A0A7K0CCP8_9ACTN|nr:hypothetical protein [Streptomyces smaragdinus]MQY11247.1 hypothetical protein [Streptomyces smaragdinus]
MNIRSLTRGDGVVIGAALLLFIASFLKFYVADCPEGLSSAQCDGINDKAPNGWAGDYYTVGFAVFLAGVIAAALIVVGRSMPEGRKPAGLSLDQLGIGFAISSLLSMLFALVNSPEGASAGIGGWLALLATLALAGGAVAGGAVPALKAPLMPAGGPRPQQPQPYGGPGQPGYGYPGAPQQGQQPYGQQQPQQPSYGQQPPQQDQRPAPAPMPNQAGPGAGGAAFSPFWFAVPAQRPLYAEDGSPSRIADLTPGTWYLAVEQRGNGLIAQTQDGRRGLLQDTNGIQRG